MLDEELFPLTVHLRQSTLNKMDYIAKISGIDTTRLASSILEGRMREAVAELKKLLAVHAT